jgi:carboxypeptidase family protein
LADPPSGDISGTIRSPDGRPVRYATVRLWQPQTRVIREGILGKTDATGHYSILRVPVGSYNLEASAENFSSERREINLRARDALKIDFLLEETMQYNASLPHAGGSGDTLIATRGQLFLGGHQLPPPYTLFYFKGALTVNGWQIPRPPEPVIVVPDSVKRASELIDRVRALSRAAYEAGKADEEIVEIMRKEYAASPIVDSVWTYPRSVMVRFRFGMRFGQQVYRPVTWVPPDPLKMRRDHLKELRDELDEGILVFIIGEGSTMTVPPPWRGELPPAVEAAKKRTEYPKGTRLRFGPDLEEQLRSPVRLVKVP